MNDAAKSIPWSIVLAVAIPAIFNTVAVAIWGATLDARSAENYRDIAALYAIADAQGQLNDTVIANTQRIMDQAERIKDLETKVDALYRYVPAH